MVSNLPIIYMETDRTMEHHGEAGETETGTDDYEEAAFAELRQLWQEEEAGVRLEAEEAEDSNLREQVESEVVGLRRWMVYGALMLFAIQVVANALVIWWLFVHTMEESAHQICR